MTYVTVFDAANEPFRNYWFFLPGIAFTVMGVLLVFAPSRLPMRPIGSREHQILFGSFFMVFAAAWTVLAGSIVVLGNLTAQASLRDGTCEVVEGRVENFQPGSGGGKKSETFTVNGERFEYSDFVVSSGFSRTASHGGPVRQGLLVRICHTDGDILRLGIAS